MLTTTLAWKLNRYVSQLVVQHDHKAHDVVFVCTMANNVWAFDVKDGAVLWKTNLGPPITPAPAPMPHPGFPTATEIDLWGVNIKWRILSTPVIDIDQQKLYVVAWTSADGSVAKSQYELHELDITNGAKLRMPQIQASAPGAGGTRRGARYLHPFETEAAGVIFAYQADI